MRNSLLMVFFWAFGALTAHAQIVTTTSALPAILTPMAKDGDQTRCIATPVVGTVRNLRIDCYIGTRRTLGITSVTGDGMISSGGVTMSFSFPTDRLKVVHFQMATNGLKAGVWTTTWMSEGNITWP